MREYKLLTVKPEFVVYNTEFQGELRNKKDLNLLVSSMTNKNMDVDQYCEFFCPKEFQYVGNLDNYPIPDYMKGMFTFYDPDESENFIWEFRGRVEDITGFEIPNLWRVAKVGYLV